LHAAVLHGGTGSSTYAAHCRLEIERRTIPGETEAQVMGEITAITEALAAADPTFRSAVRPFLSRAAFEIGEDRPVVRTLTAAAADILGHRPDVIGEPYWMDAALLAAKGIDTVVIGPSGAGAHAAVEWVELDSVVKTAEILARTAADFSGRVGG
ncbi:MAG: M20/M25/M40 family metallo-hydrolase, partial [Gemmatimonadetes bacterium]|nr:M20/M25/M40 family metallo-hydrolase [Gemmatimonadota bacterium]